MPSNRRRPEDRQLTPVEERSGILGDYPVDMSSAARCPPPPHHSLPLLHQFPPTVIPFRRIEEDSVLRFRFGSMFSMSSFDQANSDCHGGQRNTVAPPDEPPSCDLLNFGRLYQEKEHRDTGSHSQNHQRLWGDVTETESPNFTRKEYFKTSNDRFCPYPRQSPITPTPTFTPVTHPPFHRARVHSNFVETRQGPSTPDEHLQVSIICRSFDNNGDHLQQTGSRRPMDRKDTFPVMRPSESRDTTNEVRGSSDDYIDDSGGGGEGGGDVAISLRKTRRVLLPTPGGHRPPPAPGASPVSSSLHVPFLLRRPSATATQQITSFQTTTTPSSAITSSDATFPNANHLTGCVQADSLDDQSHTNQYIQQTAALAFIRNHDLLSRNPGPQRQQPLFHQHRQQSQQIPGHYSDATVTKQTETASEASETSDSASTSKKTSSSHIQEDLQSTDTFICQICRVRCASMENFDIHMLSEEHCRLMKIVARLHFKKTQQKLKSLKVNLKVNRKRCKLTPSGVESNRKSSFSFKRTGATKSKMAATNDSAKTQNLKLHKLQMNDSRQKNKSRWQRRNCVLSNKAKFKFECTLQQQDEDTSRPNHSHPRGQECIVPVSGFLCKLCNKFYNNERSAKITHCSSRKHILKYQEMLRMMKTFRETSSASVDSNEERR